MAVFLAITAFEFRHQTRQPIFWIAAVLFFLGAFAAVATPGVTLGDQAVLRNSPAAFTIATLLFALLFVFMVAAFASNVVVRDDATGFGPIVRSTPVSKAAYLYGRFVGAFAAVSVAFLSVPAGFVLGSFAPWADPEVLGPLRLGLLIQIFAVMAVPSLFATTAVCFGLTTVTRSVAATYVVIIALLASYLILPQLVPQLDEDATTAAAVLEPFGGIASMMAIRYWTPEQLNTQAAPLAGYLLANRAFVVALGLAALATAHFLYRSAEPAPRRARPAEQEAAPQPGVTIPPVEPDYGPRSLLVQTVARTRFVFRWIVTSPAFLILLLLMTAFNVPALWTANKFYETPSLPVTRVLLDQLQMFGFIMGAVVATWYAGELVWLDRDRRVDELVDASGTPSWVLMAPKVLGVILVLAAVQLTGVLTGVAVQAAKGHYEFQLDQYLAWHVLPGLVDIALLAAMTVFLHALAPSKIVGWGLTLLFLAFWLTASEIGFDHNLLVYGNAPGTPYSEMNGQGGVERAATWFRLYWSAVAVALLVIAYGVWRRGRETRLAPRLRRLPARLAGPAGLIGGAALVAACGLGGFIYLNTVVWNDFKTTGEFERFIARYEKDVLPFENTPQPSVEAVRMQVSIEPAVPRLTARGTYVLRNLTGAPLTHAHVRFLGGLEILELSIEGAQLERDFPGYGYTIWRFDRPLPPGERRTLTFATRIYKRGFTNEGPQTRIVANGTFVLNQQFAPLLGMDRSELLEDPATRRRLGLPAKLDARSRDDRAARRRNYIGADWVRTDLTVITDADQSPVAPGRVVSDQTRGGRRSVRFRSDGPILNFFSIQSARYVVLRDRHAGVDIAVYHHPRHGRNVPRMIKALKAGLDYAQANFSPYQFSQISIVEFPAYGDYAQSFPQTIPYSENAGFIADLRSARGVDYVSAVTAHELAHQWWAHQLIGADAEGADLLSETLAEYTSLMVLEKLYGVQAVYDALSFDFDDYLNGRSEDALGEKPLVRMESQPYLAYSKGSLVMYRLRQVIGETAVNRALRRLLRDHAFKGRPYPTSREFMAAVRAETPPEHQRLLTQLFEEVGDPNLFGPTVTINGTTTTRGWEGPPPSASSSPD